MNKKLTLSQRLAIRQFEPSRAEYYEDLASLMESSNQTLMRILETDEQRYVGHYRGILAQLWLARLFENGANLAEAWRGCVPESDVSTLLLLQDSGPGALPMVLRDLAASARISAQVKSEVRSALGVTFVALLMAVAAATVLPVYSVGFLLEALELPIQHWGTIGRSLAGWAHTVQQSWELVCGALGIAVAWLLWALNHFTGPTREWLDDHVFVFRVRRDLMAMNMLSTLSALVRRRGNSMLTMSKSIEALMSTSSSPWEQWRLAQVHEALVESGASSAECFNTGLLPKIFYFRLRDVEQSQGLSKAFEVTAAYVSEFFFPRLKKSLATLRAALLVVSVCVCIGMVLWLQATTAEMRNAMMNYATSNH